MKKIFPIAAVFFLVATGIHYSPFLKPSSPFDLIEPGKLVRSSSRFEVLADFDSGIAKTRRGGSWDIAKENKASVTLEALRGGAIGPYGGSLKVNYKISKGGDVTISTTLAHLDISRGTSLTGRVRSDSYAGFGGELWMGLRDDAKQYREVNVSGHIRRGGPWTAFDIPLKFFDGIDLDSLDEFSLILKSGGQEAAGALIFDEFAFFGPSDVVFESARDNIKGFPSSAAHPNRKKVMSSMTDPRKFLRQIALDTWGYFDAIIDQDSHLVLDHARLGSVKGLGGYTSTSNIAFYWLACIAASDLGFISADEAEKRINESLETTEKLERWNDRHYYNFYNTHTLQVTRRYVSTVDNGWLVASLLVVRQAFPGKFDARIEKILKAVDFSEFFDESNGQLKIGFDEDNGSFAPHHYGLIASEARLTSYVAIAKGDLPESHWARIFRTPPVEWDWQRQVPKGETRTLFEIPVWEGYYTYQGIKIVPSWGGSLFEFLAPILLLNEQTFGQHALGLNNQRAVQAHMDYALRVKQYPVWGLAPAATEDGKGWSYREYGMSEIAVKGYRDEQVVTPYASALAIEIEPEAVIENLKKLVTLYPDLYGPYGFYDSVDVMKKQVNQQYLALDQGMILVALANYLTRGAIRNRFHQDPIGEKGRTLLTSERFFESI